MKRVLLTLMVALLAVPVTYAQEAEDAAEEAAVEATVEAVEEVPAASPGAIPTEKKPAAPSKKDNK